MLRHAFVTAILIAVSVAPGPSRAEPASVEIPDFDACLGLMVGAAAATALRSDSVASLSTNLGRGDDDEDQIVEPAPPPPPPVRPVRPPSGPATDLLPGILARLCPVFSISAGDSRIADLCQSPLYTLQISCDLRPDGSAIVSWLP